MQVYELITCVHRANENAGNLISVVQFLIISNIQESHPALKILQPIAQQHKLDLKDTTDSINFLKKKKTSKKDDPCHNGRNEPVNKYTTGGGNKYSMHSMQKLL